LSPPLTAPSASFAAVIASSATSTVAMVPSKIFALVTDPSANSDVSTAPAAILAAVIASSAMSTVAIVPSKISAVVIPPAETSSTELKA